MKCFWSLCTLFPQLLIDNILKGSNDYTAELLVLVNESVLSFLCGTWFLPCSQLQPQSGGKPCVPHGPQLRTVYIKAPSHLNRTETGSLHVLRTALRRGLLPLVRGRTQGEGTGSSWGQFALCQKRDCLAVCPCVLVPVLHVQLPYISLGPRWGAICLQTQTWSPADVPTPDVVIHHLQCQSDFHNPVIYGIFKQPEAKSIPVP